ncbi:alpha/beta hydrolase [Mucilaginibacter kameinonensis]|uniref:alpha/beta hydrolase n=1 Tax=Mucilaginibacter kameinonensis TaxID=452286 RepID=UPI000EF7DBE8|nr:alpha/beta hydrolase-fold protein [Mucilaginibacter kameinonensis]
MLKQNLKLSIILLLLLFAKNTVTAQVKSDTPTPFTDKDMVQLDYHSTVIGDDYTIYIHFPPGYDTTKTKYPVLYMTDGDWNMTVAMNCFNMLRQDYETTEALIVGIGYGNRPNQRSRDLNPATGGPKFISFIEHEVIPFVQSKYRVNDNKALYGYSFGGMFTTMVLFDHPSLFNMIFIGAPGNSGSELIPSAKKYFANNHDLNSRVFLGVGSFEQLTSKNIQEFKSYMENQHCQGLDIATAITPNAGHGAALAQVMQNAIKFAYCKLHKEISIPVKDLQQYTGNYVIAGDTTKGKFKLYTNDNKLYFANNGQLPIAFVPFAKDSFFMYENERDEIFFHKEAGKLYMLYSPLHEKPTRLDKVK